MRVENSCKTDVAVVLRSVPSAPPVPCLLVADDASNAVVALLREVMLAVRAVGIAVTRQPPSRSRACEGIRLRP